MTERYTIPAGTTLDTSNLPGKAFMWTTRGGVTEIVVIPAQGNPAYQIVAANVRQAYGIRRVSWARGKSVNNGECSAYWDFVVGDDGVIRGWAGPVIDTDAVPSIPMR